MTCYKPNTAYRLTTVNPKTGKNWICFQPTQDVKEILQLPCGQCYGCRLERSRVWAIRCMHELQSHIHNQYVTLTYTDKELPKNSSLNSKHLTNFYKRLRKDFPPKSIRHYSCGEYGEETDRPHYHAIIFGLKLDDLEYYKTTKQGHKIYNSEYMDHVWSHGNVIIGNVTFESCAYVARYIMKKITGEKADEHYKGRTKEFTRMSNRPGISTEWYNKYKGDIYNNNEGTVKIRGGIQSQPPRFYEDKYQKENPVNHEIIKLRRKEKAIINMENNTKARLAVRLKVLERKTQSLIRTLE